MSTTYVVQIGDTLHRIARRYGIHPASLTTANPQLKDTEYIVPGQVLHIPIRPSNAYVVQKGDSLYDIARRFDIALHELLRANPDVNPPNLTVGQTILIPIGKGMDIIDTSGPYGYSELIEDISLLLERYPFIQVEYIGESVMGKPIPAARIGGGPRQIQVNASFHANEWITTSLAMKFLEQFAKAYEAQKSIGKVPSAELMRQSTLFIVPMVNPDGVELVQEGITPQHPFYEQLLEWNDGSFDFRGWKANIRGVDLNDQFPAHWEAEKGRRSDLGPGPRDFGGEAPLTEPEARAMADYTRNHKFDQVFALHTQGKEMYWNYRDFEPPESEKLAARYGRVSGYKPVKLSGSDAGYKDWFIQDFRKPGFTIEAGEGVNPLPVSQFPDMYRAVSAILVEALKP